MNFLSYLLQHPVSSIFYVIAAIGYTIALIRIYKGYKKSRKLSHTQKVVLIAIGCSISLFGVPQFLENENPSPVSILIGLAVFALAILLIFITIFKVTSITSKKGR